MNYLTLKENKELVSEERKGIKCDKRKFMRWLCLPLKIALFPIYLIAKLFRWVYYY